MVKRDAKAETFEDGAAGAQPFLAERDRGAEYVRIGLK